MLQKSVLTNFPFTSFDRHQHFLFFLSPSPMVSSHRYYSKDFKERVVKYYHDHRSSFSFTDVAKLFGVAGGRMTVSRWYKQFLSYKKQVKTKERTGRPTLWSRAQMNKFITRKIKSKNRLHEPIHYTTLQQEMKEESEGKLSLRTIQRYGKEKLGIKNKPTITRTAQEYKFSPHLTCTHLSLLLTFSFG